jgi:hypothetical protein
MRSTLRAIWFWFLTPFPPTFLKFDCDAALAQHIMDHLPMHIRQTEIATLIAIR